MQWFLWFVIPLRSPGVHQGRLPLQAYKERSAAKNVLPGKFIHHLFSYNTVGQITSLSVQDKQVMICIHSCLADEW